MELRKEMADLRASHRDTIADVARKQDVADRMANIIVSGLPESKDEDTKQAVNHLFTDTLKVTSNIVSARRLPDPRTTSKNTNRPRLVHVRSGSIDDKLRVVRARSQLKGTTIFLNEDLTKPEQEQKKRLLPKLKALRAKNIKSVHFRRAVLYFQKQPLTDTKMEELLQTPGQGEPLLIGCIYRPPSASVRAWLQFEDEVENRLRFRPKSDVILTGDFNVDFLDPTHPHLPHLKHFLATFNLLNHTTAPTRISTQRNSCLDLFITSEDLPVQSSNPFPAENINTDHELILSSLPKTSSKPHKKDICKSSRALSKINSNSFEKSLRQSVAPWTHCKIKSCRNPGLGSKMV